MVWNDVNDQAVRYTSEPYLKQVKGSQSDGIREFILIIFHVLTYIFFPLMDLQSEIDDRANTADTVKEDMSYRQTPLCKNRSSGGMQPAQDNTTARRGYMYMYIMIRDATR